MSSSNASAAGNTGIALATPVILPSMSDSGFSHLGLRQKLVLGADALDRVGTEATAQGMARPLLICSARARVSVLFHRVEASFGSVRPTMWSEVPVHAPLSTTLRAAAFARAAGCDGIVAFGGGSVSDLAKGVALALAEGDTLEPFVVRREHGQIVGQTSMTPKLPIIAVPTTLSGAEVTPGFSLTRDDAYKLLFRDPQLAARVVLLDPAVLSDLPQALLAGTLANALAHGCEALYSLVRTPISSLFARDGLRELMHGADLWFAAAHDGQPIDAGLRRQGSTALLLGGYLVATAIVNARTALHHATCHKLAPVLGASHGEINALILPHALAFNLPACAQALEDIASAIGCATASVESVIERLNCHARRSALRQRLREFGVERDCLADVAQRVYAEPGLAFNPRPISSAAQIEQMLDGAW